MSDSVLRVGILSDIVLNERQDSAQLSLAESRSGFEMTSGLHLMAST